MSGGDWIARSARHEDRDFWCLGFRKGGVRTFGEATAMPGYSSETSLEQTYCVRDLLLALPSLDGTSTEDVERALLGLELTPAVRFGAETALARWAAQKQGLTLAEWWGARPGSGAQCNGLVPKGLGAADAARHAVGQRDAGVRCLKVKVSGTSSDIERLRAIAEAAPELSLRLDANAAWSAEQATEFLSSVSRYAFDYCEQPLAPDAMPPGSLGAPIALDETLRHVAATSAWLGCETQALTAYLSSQGPLPELTPHADLRALVLKPTILGGTAICLRWATLARACGLDVVFTHTFEGPLGLAACRAAALAAGVGHVPQGLASYEALSAWSSMRESDFPIRFDGHSLRVALGAADSARV
ncbi:MAG: L-alanine-DL-glutamate epimerase-like enolase superfamily enzyme [Flavobacteriales bacterium]|jgi:L-alanine-DL-glutamate epimerase-like enolase superfamily enzyme